MMPFFASEGPHVSLVAEPIFHIGPLEIRNSFVLGVVGTAIMLWLFFYTVKRARRGKHNRLSMAILWAFEGLLGTIEEVVGSREMARKVAPLSLTIFFLVIINNWLELVPFVGPITWHASHYSAAWHQI